MFVEIQSSVNDQQHSRAAHTAAEQSSSANAQQQHSRATNTAAEQSKAAHTADLLMTSSRADPPTACNTFLSAV